MGNKVITISTNSSKRKKDDSSNDIRVVEGLSANNSYVYMDIDMVSQYKRDPVVSLSSIRQYEYILGSEKQDNKKYPISGLVSKDESLTEEEIVEIFLKSKSSLTVTKKIDNFISNLKKNPIDTNKVVEVDPDRKLYVYRY